MACDCFENSKPMFCWSIFSLPFAIIFTLWFIDAIKFSKKSCNRIKESVTVTAEEEKEESTLSLNQFLNYHFNH